MCQLTAFIEKNGKWGRYWDVDGDGVGYRTLPGTNHPNGAYFVRGTGHNAMAVYSERSDDWVENMTRLRKKFDSARHIVPQPIVDYTEGKKVGIITFGTNEAAIQEARDCLAEDGIATNYMRVRALPMPESVREFVLKHEHVYVIENDFDGQLHQLINMEISEDTRHMKALALGDSLPMTPEWVVEQIETHIKG
jgi:2-oxoglutarate ferredoxin oxidoreductase subunit alpha